MPRGKIKKTCSNCMRREACLMIKKARKLSPGSQEFVLLAGICVDWKAEKD